MTTKTNMLFFGIVCLLFCVTSCKKDNVNPNPQLPISSDDVSEADAPGLYQTVSGFYKLVLQPGDDKGQDAWVEFSSTNPDFATHNSGPVDQFKVMGWTDWGNFFKVRSLIRFDELYKIPSSGQVIKSKLFLYGLTESPYHLPEGNSYYPGSPYNSYGPNDVYVQKITSAWDEASVTWSSIPSATTDDESLIPPSDKQWGYNASVDVSKIVRTFVKNPSQNYGFMLELVNENVYHSMGFYSSEYVERNERPKLVIVYTK